MNGFTPVYKDGPLLLDQYCVLCASMHGGQVETKPVLCLLHPLHLAYERTIVIKKAGDVKRSNL